MSVFRRWCWRSPTSASMRAWSGHRGDAHRLSVSGALLARSPGRQGLAMVVIAGDITEGGGVPKQLGGDNTD